MKNQVEIKMNEIISKAFKDAAEDIVRNKHSHYIFKGGRGSAKSSFISLMIIIGMITDKNANAVALRQNAVTLNDSVYSQLIWAINLLGLTEYFEFRKTPLKIIYKTGQQILFRGADDPVKLKSLKAEVGYFKYVWFEELAEFKGISEIRNINQSVLRGGNKFQAFYSFNPPKSVHSFVNKNIENEFKDSYLHHSTYLSTPKHWLGEEFISSAEHLKNTKPEAYRHEYLGEVTGTGGSVFRNLEIREIMENELLHVQKKYCGLDWGFSVDPAVFIDIRYDSKKNIVYIPFEIYGQRMLNRDLAERIILSGYKNEIIYADCAEPKSIFDLYDMGINIYAVKKWQGSVKNGIEFLQGLEKIIIESRNCPNTVREFLHYEYEKDSDGNFKSGYPDKNNHTIDAARYALTNQILERKDRSIVINYDNAN